MKRRCQYLKRWLVEFEQVIILWYYTDLKDHSYSYSTWTALGGAKFRMKKKWSIIWLLKISKRYDL